MFDTGLLSPVTAGSDAPVVDAEVLAALVTAEVALARAWAAVTGRVTGVDEIESVFGWRGDGALVRDPDATDAGRLAADARSGGNVVIPLVRAMKQRVGEDAGRLLHRGATSQDILDSGLMLLARLAGTTVGERLAAIEARLADFAVRHRDLPAAARTLTQHAVPTTVGLRASVWLRAVRRARVRLEEAVAALPAQLGGAAGTQASFVAFARIDGLDAGTVDSLSEHFAGALGLAVADAPWHTSRWPVTELADALVQSVDAFGMLASTVATLSRTEIGELSEAEAGGSSAMPQKQNPVAAVLIRSAALRAPQLGATLHLASALAVDERPDGAWHAEWPALRELLRLALGATARGLELVSGLRVDAAAVLRNLHATDGMILAERLAIELSPVIGRDAVSALIIAATDDRALRPRLVSALRDAGVRAAEETADTLLDPTGYVGRAGLLVDRAGAAR